ncbi:MAG: lasso peptide isopeptide bond-forming cyclase, partial [Gemmatimonadaceae bacterium]
MGGIAGVWYLDGRPTTREIAGRLEEAVRHRGPDAGGSWAGEEVALAQRLLWTTPQSLSEHGPHASTEGRVVLCADLRIDNRGELLDACGVRGPERAAIGDVELLLMAYTLWGSRCPERLIGDFAFAVWDARRELLFCARDHVGVKPFFYHHAPGRVFAFASESKGVLAVHEVPRRLNEARLIDYIERSFDDKTATFYADILRLPPGHSLTVTRDGVRTSPYWSLDPTKELRLGAKEYAPAFRELFVEAVRCRLRSAFPVGGMLSGGLDSSSIVCVARNLAAAEEPKIPLHSFSAVFDETPECDERPYIETVTAVGGLQSHFIRADQVGPMDDLDRILWEQDEPFFAPNLFMHRALYAAARTAGVRVLLDGFDGDTAVSHGAKYLTELGAGGRWLTLGWEIAWLAWRSGRSPSSLVRKHVLSPLTPARIRRYVRGARPRRAPGRAPHPILDRSFAERAGWSDRMGARAPTARV